MRKLVLPAILAMATNSLHAQPNPPTTSSIPHAYESQVDYQKTRQQAVLIDLPYTEDVVETTIKEYMSRQGWKSSGSHGYMVFRNVRLTDTARNLNDLYIKVDRKNKDRNAAVVTALTVRPGEDPATRISRDELEIIQGRLFLERMAPSIAAGDLEAKIRDQESMTKKSQGKLGDLRDDQLDLEKKIRNTQSDITENKADQVKETQNSTNAIDANAAAKSQKKMKGLVSDQGSLQKKLQKYQASLEENKKDQQSQEALAGQQQHALDSLRTMRNH